MAKIDNRELLKIARISNLKLYPEELESFEKHLQEVLSYSESVGRILSEHSESSYDLYCGKAVNVMREDIADKSDPAPLLAAAPEGQEGYFVVPRVL